METTSWHAEIGSIPVEFGTGFLDRLGEVAGALGGTRALVVTDPGLRAALFAFSARGGGLAQIVLRLGESDPRGIERDRSGGDARLDSSGNFLERGRSRCRRRC